MFPVIKMAVNRKGGLYIHGTKLPPMFRERVNFPKDSNVILQFQKQAVSVFCKALQKMSNDISHVYHLVRKGHVSYPSQENSRKYLQCGLL